MNDTETATAQTGHNLPPQDPGEALLIRLREDHVDLLKRKDELLAGIEHAPEEIEDGDEDTAGRMADFVDQINAFLKHARETHEDEKAPFLAAGRTVDSFKHMLIDDIEKGKAAVNRVCKVYGDRKAAAEKLRREEAERVAREEAREAQRIADEAAEARRAEAAEAQRIADEAASELQDEADYKAALLAQKEADRVKRSNIAAGKAEQKEADRAAKAAIKAAKAAAAKPAELAPVRGEYGGRRILKQFWDFHELDRAALDLEALRAHFTTDAFEKAIRSWINANKEALERGATLAGVNIYSDTRL